MRSLLAILLIASVPAVVRAQDPELPPGHPPIGELPPEDADAQDGHDHEGADRNPHGGMGRRVPGMGGREGFDRSEPDPELPRGTILVRVVDAEGNPVQRASVELGALSGGNAERKVGRTGAEGEFRWDGLPTSRGRAYRVVVTNGPARFAAPPFQLTASSGHRVTVTRWNVTDSTANLLAFVVRTFLELAQEGNRIRVTQHLQLMNIGTEAIAPEGGIALPMPAGMKAFRTEQGMGDQRLEERDGKVWLEGSVPPGEVQLAYGFDLDTKGSSFRYEQRLPFRVVLAEAYAEKTPGMTFRAPGMHDPQEVDIEGRPFFTSRITRRPQSPNFTKLRIELDGLPGPGPGRWIALGLGVLAMALGLASLLSGNDRRAAERAALMGEKERLLSEAERIEAQHKKGKLDASLYERVRERNLTRLAEVLRLEDRG